MNIEVLNITRCKDNALLTNICKFRQSVYTNLEGDWPGPIDDTVKVGSFSCNNDCPLNAGTDFTNQIVYCKAKMLGFRTKD